MNSENYEELYDILLYFNDKHNLIQEKIDANLLSIKEADYYAANLKNRDENDFKIFSPREENVHKVEIEKSNARILELKKINTGLYDELKCIDLYIEKINKIIQTEKESSAVSELRDRNLAVLKIQEEDRQRIARDLHDTALQNLAHLIHKIELANIFINQDPLRAKLEISVVKKDLKNLIEQIRDAIFDLRPMTFDDLGLKAALEELFRTINHDMKYTIETEIENVSCENSLMILTIYRIIQECIYNINKHAQADKIVFKLGMCGNNIIIDITDNGKGFSMEEIKDKQSRHFGLSVMYERVNLLNGKIDIHSEKDKGTNVHIEVPVSEPENESIKK